MVNLLLQQVLLLIQHQQTLEQAPQVLESVLEEQVQEPIHLEVDLEVLQEEWVEWADSVAVCHQAWEWEECHLGECLLHSRCNK